MDPVGFFHIARSLAETAAACLNLLMPDPHLHVCDWYVVLFKTGRIWIFDPSCLFQDIKRFNKFIHVSPYMSVME